MTDNFPTSLTREFDEDNDLLKQFTLPKTNTDIIHSQYERADIAENLDRHTKISTYLLYSPAKTYLGAGAMLY